MSASDREFGELSQCVRDLARELSGLAGDLAAGLEILQRRETCELTCGPMQRRLDLLESAERSRVERERSARVQVRVARIGAAAAILVGFLALAGVFAQIVWGQ